MLCLVSVQTALVLTACVSATQSEDQTGKKDPSVERILQLIEKDELNTALTALETELANDRNSAPLINLRLKLAQAYQFAGDKDKAKEQQRRAFDELVSQKQPDLDLLLKACRVVTADQHFTEEGRISMRKTIQHVEGIVERVLAGQAPSKEWLALLKIRERRARSLLPDEKKTKTVMRETVNRMTKLHASHKSGVTAVLLTTALRDIYWFVEKQERTDLVQTHQRVALEYYDKGEKSLLDNYAELAANAASSLIEEDPAGAVALAEEAFQNYDQRSKNRYGPEIQALAYARNRAKNEFAYQSMKGKPIPGLGTGTWIGSDKAPELHNKVRLYIIWGAYCDPCIEAFPRYNKLVKENKPNGLEVIGLTALLGLRWDGESPIARRGDTKPEEEVKHLKAFAAHYKLTFPTIIYPTAKALTTFGARAYPQYLLTDKDGVVRYLATGGSKDKLDKLEAEINKLLAGKN